jgi:hypothetical protein
MNAYFATNHAAAALFTLTIAAWGMMELSQRSQPSREGATKITGTGGRLVALACVIATTVVVRR